MGNSTWTGDLRPDGKMNRYTWILKVYCRQEQIGCVVLRSWNYSVSSARLKRNWWEASRPIISPLPAEISIVYKFEESFRPFWALIKMSVLNLINWLFFRRPQLLTNPYKWGIYNLLLRERNFPWLHSGPRTWRSFKLPTSAELLL